MTSFRSRGRVRVASVNLQLLQYPRSEPDLYDAARFRALSTSHTVAADDGCTNIPLAACRAQEDENHSRKRHFRPWLASVRPPGSARTDQVQEDDGVR
jgi:hypothetical protein